MIDIIHGLGNEEYHHGEPYREYLSSSQLKLYAKSPRYARYMMEHPQEPTEAMRLGSLFHDLMAGVATHNGDYSAAHDEWVNTVISFLPPVNEKTGLPYGTSTKAFKEAQDRFLAENEEMTIAPAQDVVLAMQMALSLLNDCGSTSQQVRKLLKWGKPEVSHFFEYQGCRFKFRPDLETRDKIIDYKTVATDDLGERSINGIIAKYGYDISAAFYQWGEHEQSGVWKTFYWLFVSKQPPYDAVLVDSSKWTYERDPDSGIVIPQVGAVKMKRLVDLHIRCTTEGRWPGAEVNVPMDGYGKRIMCPAPPPWEISNATAILDQSYNEQDL